MSQSDDGARRSSGQFPQPPTSGGGYRQENKELRQENETLVKQLEQRDAQLEQRDAQSTFSLPIGGAPFSAPFIDLRSRRGLASHRPLLCRCSLGCFGPLVASRLYHTMPWTPLDASVPGVRGRFPPGLWSCNVAA